MHTYTYVGAYKCIHAHMYICKYVFHIHTQAYKHTSTQARKHIDTDTNTRNFPFDRNKDIYIFPVMLVLSVETKALLSTFCVRVRVYMYVYVYV